jgi:hypothetical protein
MRLILYTLAMDASREISTMAVQVHVALQLHGDVVLV